MPRRGTSCGGQRARSMPSNSIVPRLFATSPMMARSVVVFPTPLRPSRAADSPGPTSRLTPWRMCSLPIWTWRSSSLSMRGLLDVILVLGAAEIRLADPLVGGDLLRGAGGEDRALRHHGDVGGDLEYHLHVMLDDDDVDGARQRADVFHRAIGLGRAHPAGRFVEQQEARFGYERHPDL